jgi:hypothetical protein
VEPFPRFPAQTPGVLLLIEWVIPQQPRREVRVLGNVID